MSIKNVVSLFAAVLIGYTISPTYSGDLISCDSFENCPDGSVPLTNALLALEARIEALEALLAGVSRGTDSNTSQDTLTFTNMNVQVVSGSGTTDGGVTGTGNLIIGYNELRGIDDRTGSHMLIIGKQNNYSSFGGMVIGQINETSAPFATVSGGISNTASGQWASVSGGFDNTASGEDASVSGGFDNTASGIDSSVSGGLSKTADSDWCTTAGEIGTDCVP